MRTSLKWQETYHHTSRKSDSLYVTCEKFVNAREQAYERVSPKRMVHFEAISALKRMLDFYRFSPHGEFCQVVLKHEKYLRTLIPLPSSRFYAGAQTKVNAMINYANQYLNQ